MPEIKLEYPELSPCFHCGKDMALAVNTCSSCGKDAPHRLTVGELLLAFTSGLMLDVRMGGFVAGRDGPEEDVRMYRATVPGILQLCGFIQGGQFIVNGNAANENYERLEEINSEYNRESTSLNHVELFPSLRIYNTNGIGEQGDISVLIQSGQFIVNRHATKTYLSELLEINDSAMPKLG